MKKNSLDNNSTEKNNNDKGYWGDIFDKLIPLEIVKNNKSVKYYYYFDVPNESLNQMSNMHGGAIYTLLNILGIKTLNDFSYQSGFRNKFMLTEMVVKYLSPVKKQSKILVEIFIEKLGKSISYVTMTIFSPYKNMNLNEINFENNGANLMLNFSILNRATASYHSISDKTAKF